MKTQIPSISRQYRNTILWVSLLFTLSLIIIISLIWGAAKAVDTSDLQHTQRMINQSVQTERERLLNQLKDYAIWDEAYQQWQHNSSPSTQWVKSNFGDSLYNNLGIEWVMVKNHHGQIIFSNTPGKQTSNPTLLADLIDSALNMPEMTTQIVIADGSPWLLASHAVLPEDKNAPLKPHNKHFIFARPLASTLLPHLRLHVEINDLHFSLQPISEMSQLSVDDPQGSPLAYFTWQANNPGSRLLQELLPGIILLLALLAAATLLLIMRLVTQGKKSLQKIAAFADTRSALSRQQESILRLRQRFQEQPNQEAFLAELIHESQQLILSDIAAIWLLDNNGEAIICKASNSTMKHKKLPVTALDDCLQKLQQKPVLIAGHKDLCQITTDSSRFYRTLQGYMIDYNMQSVAMTGIYLGGELRGILTFASLQDKTWNPAERNACSTLAGVIAQFAEAFQRQEIEQDLYQKLNFDPVTELPRLAYAQQHFTGMLDQRKGYLAIFRIQGLHVVNELHGLEAGNELFRSLSQFIGQYISHSLHETLLIRLPANRIGLFINAPRDDVEQHLQQLIIQTEEHSWNIRRRPYNLTLQVGLAGYPEDGQDIEILQHRAKLALQYVRNAPEIDLAFYSDDVHTGLKERNDAIREIREALEKEAFELFFQPQYNLQGRIAGAEALIRWRHPERGLLTPYHFIDLAEETGLIVPLGRWILQQACQKLASQKLAHTNISLSVNISVLQLQQENFVDEIRDLLQQHTFSPDQLVLEIVESLLIEQDVKDKLVQLRELGVQIALDDFGTGYSSLSYLQELQLDELKVDQSFIQALEHQDDAPLVRTIIAMAHTLNMRVVVEGVETDAQLAFVQQQGAELIQGYRLARPMPWSDFMALSNQPVFSELTV